MSRRSKGDGMSKRKGWDQLSDAYRKRLSRAGISKQEYESGASIQRARGHATTPERPESAYTIRGRQRYREYLERVGGLRAQVIEKKVRLFSDRFKWHPDRARKYIMEGGADIPKPGPEQLRQALQMTDDEIEELLQDPNIDEQWKFLWYH